MNTKKEPITNLVFAEVLKRLKAIQAGDSYFCSPMVYDYKKQLESKEFPAIVLYQAGDEWSTGGGNGSNDACGNVEINVSQQIIITLFHDSVEQLNRLKADVEIALRVNDLKAGNLLLPAGENSGVAYALQGPVMALPPEDLMMGHARFTLTAIYSRAHGSP